VTDFTNQYSAVLADLEERKAALRSRLESLDATIAGLRALTDLPSATDSPVLDSPVNRVPVREHFTYTAPVENRPVRQAPQQPAYPPRQATYQRNQLQTQSDPAQERTDELTRQLPLQGPSASPERRRATGLNVYVNQNSEWAARQMVAASSPRSIFRQPTGHRCPKCGSQDTRVSTTRGLSDIFMFLFEYSVGRCRNCDTRFRIWQAREEDPTDDDLTEAAAAAE
jgi:hypothetical protein